MKGRNRAVLVFAGAMLLAGSITGCSEKSMTVYIKDGQVQTEIAVESGATVAEALSEAEIEWDEKDEVTPAADSVLEDQTEITINRYAKVTVTEGEQTSEWELTGKKVQDVLDAEGIVLGEHDYVNHASEAYLTNGMEIEVVHRFAVTIKVDGDSRKCLTKTTDVESLLEEQGIAVDKKDRVKPGLEEALTDDMKITIKRVSVKEVVETESIPFETETKYTSSLYTDQKKEKTAGVEGEKEVTYQVTYVDGKEESRKAVSEKVVKEPVSQVILKGTKKRRKIVSKEKVADCDGSGHGYYIIKWSDGEIEYQDY